MSKDEEEYQSRCLKHTVEITRMAEQMKGDREERERFRQMLRTDMDEIKSLVTKTNGRVKVLEAWKTFLTGGFVALSMPAAAKLVVLLSSR